MRNKIQCPYRSKSQCTHKYKEITKTSRKRICSYKNCPEKCDMYLDYIEMIDMEYLERSDITMANISPEGVLK